LIVSRRERILSITHQQDVDGLFCGAILKNAFPNTFVYLTNYGYGNILRITDAIETSIIKSKRQGTIIVSDIVLNNKEEANAIRITANKAREHNWDLVWIDHHIWRKEIKDLIQPSVTLVLPHNSEQKCASELICDAFNIQRTACLRMAKFARVADFRLPEINSMPPLPEMIRYYLTFPDYYKKLHFLVNKASRGIFWDDTLQEEYVTKYLPLKESAIKDAMTSLTVTFIHGFKVGVIESPKILSKSILSEIVFKKYTDLDIVFLFAPDGKINIRRQPNSDIRCDLIAQKLNGGGHSYAAAGRINLSNPAKDAQPKRIDTQDVLKTLDAIL
jgi:oligoribonuclease NrnB/cAMP/cGMP phosphodiesterase (DHH superfamily)